MYFLSFPSQKRSSSIYLDDMLDCFDKFHLGKLSYPLSTRCQTSAMATQNVADVGQPEPRIRNCKYEIGRKRCAEVQDDDSGCLGPRCAQCAFGLWTPQLVVMFVQALKTQPAGTFANYVHPSDGSWLPWLDRARSKHERFEDAMATRPPQTRLDNSDSENAKTSVILWGRKRDWI